LQNEIAHKRFTGGGRLPLLSARFAVTFPATEHHCPLAGNKLYCLVTKAHRCEQLAQGYCAALPRVGFELTTCLSYVQCSTCCTAVLKGAGTCSREACSLLSVDLNRRLIQSSLSPQICVPQTASRSV